MVLGAGALRGTESEIARFFGDWVPPAQLHRKLGCPFRLTFSMCSHWPFCFSKN